MEIVPVIDLKGGQVVHARGGARDAYEPIRSLLAAGSEPLAVVRGLCALHPFTTLYVADLDAIEGRGGHETVLTALVDAFQGLRLWVDNGLASEDECRAWLERGLGDLVLGSESQRDAGLLGALRDRVDAGRVVLSLDFKGAEFLGPPALLEDPACWPARVIVMTLARVGGALGPDFERLQALRARAPGHEIYAAGGARGVEDLGRLAALGAAGVLVASVLHDGRVTREQLETFGARAGPG